MSKQKTSNIPFYAAMLSAGTLLFSGATSVLSGNDTDKAKSEFNGQAVKETVIDSRRHTAPTAAPPLKELQEAAGEGGYVVDEETLLIREVEGYTKKGGYGIYRNPPPPAPPLHELEGREKTPPYRHPRL